MESLKGIATVTKGDRGQQMDKLCDMNNAAKINMFDSVHCNQIIDNFPNNKHYKKTFLPFLLQYQEVAK